MYKLYCDVWRTINQLAVVYDESAPREWNHVHLSMLLTFFYIIINVAVKVGNLSSTYPLHHINGVYWSSLCFSFMGWQLFPLIWDAVISYLWISTDISYIVCVLLFSLLCYSQKNIYNLSWCIRYVWFTCKVFRYYKKICLKVYF